MNTSKILFTSLTITLTGLMVLFTQLGQAAEMPCVKEICVGDGLDKLRGINWVPIDLGHLNRVKRSERMRRAKTYKGFDGDNTPNFLVLRAFDGSVLEDIAKIKTACEANELVGSYISDGGNKTKVYISLLPIDDAGNMTWRVRSITRKIQTLEPADKNHVVQTLNARYGKFKQQPNSGEGGYMVIPLHKEVGMSLHLGVADDLIRFKRNAFCATHGKVSVD